MKKAVYLFEDGEWDNELDGSLDSENTLIVCFGASEHTTIQAGLNDLVNTYPNSKIMGCSTAGEIYDDIVYDETLSVAVMNFEKTDLKFHNIELNSSSDSFNNGNEIAKALQSDDLKSIFVLSDGLNVNGSQLTKGINDKIEDSVVVTGGLAGDGANFQKTWVLVDNKPVSNYITSVGFYGENVHIAHGSQGGWQKFGIDRMVTEANDNVLYKLDNKPALEVYKTYLGESAKDLPSSGLLYPLMIKEEGFEEAKVRTILAVEEETQSITFAGDIPNGSEVMFMKATTSQLVDGASSAAQMLDTQGYDGSDAVNIAISCVGRKLVLGQKVEDEIEAVLGNIPESIGQIGYYSYGEISPLASGKCDLHNQTMTLTFIWES